MTSTDTDRLAEAERNHGLDSMRSRLAAAESRLRGRISARPRETVAVSGDDLALILLDHNDWRMRARSAETRVEQLQGQRDAVCGLHKPERRYTPNLAESCSFDTPEEAAEYDDIDIELVAHFDVCAHCGSIEMDDGDSYGRDYRESLWPCKTAKALGLDKEPTP